MLLQTAFAALIRLTTASLSQKFSQRNTDVWMEERQAYPYPAFTIDQIVSSSVLLFLFNFIYFFDFDFDFWTKD
jgi:hypothetical protein